jgi:hypothetical protein
MIINWIDEGSTSNEKNLNAIRTECLKKDSNLLSVCKSFKAYADSDG